MTKTEMRDHLRHSRYIVAPEMVEHDHDVANTLHGLGEDAAYWAAPGSTDWAHGEALFMALELAQVAELARYGINEADVESLGYWILVEMHADANTINENRK